MSISIFLIACGGGEDNENNNNSIPESEKIPLIDISTFKNIDELSTQVHHLDLSNSHGFIISGDTPEDTESNKNNKPLAREITDADLMEANSLYKITTDGKVERVGILDENDAELPRGTVKPIGVQEIDDNYLVMWIGLQEIKQGFLHRIENINRELENINENTNNEGVSPFSDLGRLIEECSLDVNNLSFDLVLSCIAGADRYDTTVKPYLIHRASGFAYDATSIIPNRAVKQKSNSGSGVKEYSIDPYVFSTKTDQNGNIYLIDNNGYQSDLFKIDGNDIGSSALSAQSVQSIDYVTANPYGGKFVLDHSGDFLTYRGKNIDDQNEVIRFLNLKTGALAKVILPDSLTVNSAFQGLDGRLYLDSKIDQNSNGSGKMFRIDLDENDKFNPVEIGTCSSTTASTGIISNHCTPTDFDPRSVGLQYFYGSERHIIAGQLIYINARRTDNGLKQTFGSVISIEPDKARWINHDVPANLLDEIRDVQISGDYLFFFGNQKGTANDVILRYNPVSFEHDIFSVDVDLDISSFRAFSTNVVWFEAVRLSDSTNVIGEIALDGTVTITDTIEATEPPILLLAAIHPTDFITINGDYQDWATDNRILTDVLGDTDIGHDLSFYSHQQSDNLYFGLIEFNQDKHLGQDRLTVVEIDNMYQLRFDRGVGKYRILANNDESKLFEAGGLSALGKAIEFSIPLNKLADAPLSLVNVKRFIIEYYGAVSNIVSELKVSQYQFTVNLDAPLGDGQREVTLSTGHILRFTKSSAFIVNPDTTEEDLVSIGGDILYPDVDGDPIIINIPGDVFSGLTPFGSTGYSVVPNYINTFTIEMASPLGDAQIDVEFNELNHKLELTKSGALITDETGSTDIVSAGGSISFPDVDGGNIELVIPSDLFGTITNLQPSITSETLEVEVLLDDMN